MGVMPKGIKLALALPPPVICELAILTVPKPDITRSTVALFEPKFVAGSGVRPRRGGRVRGLSTKLVMLAAVGGPAVRSLFGSEKIEVPIAVPSPSPPPLLGKLLVPITTESWLTPRVGKSPNVFGLLLKCTDEKPFSGLLSRETATRIWLTLVPVPPP